MAKKSTSVKTPVRIGILGCGGFANSHARTLNTIAQAKVVALCDTNPANLDKFLNANYATLAEKPVLYQDPARMYAQSKLDGVIIATPHTLHFQHAVQALQAGCHVLIEKPMVTSLVDAYALEKVIAKTGKILTIGYNTPCTGEFAYLREQIRKGTFGKLELIVGYLSQDWKRLTTGLWRQDPKLSGGGQAYDSGAHLLNSLVWSVESDIDQVFAFQDNCGTPVDINSSINIRFANGVMASIVVSGNCPSAGRFMSFMFDNGRVDIDGWGGSWIKVWQGNREIKYPPIDETPNSPDHNFINSILGLAEPRTSVRNGIIHSQLMDAIYESARTGKPANTPKR